MFFLIIFEGKLGGPSNFIYLFVLYLLVDTYNLHSMLIILVTLWHFLLKSGRNIVIGASGGGSSENSSICIFVSSFLAIGSLLFSDFIAGWPDSYDLFFNEFFNWIIFSLYNNTVLAVSNACLYAMMYVPICQPKLS